IEGVGGTPFAFAYFDKDGKEISNANRSQKIAECRSNVNKCDVQRAEWIELEPEYSEWADDETPSAATYTHKCYKNQRRTIIIREKNTCSNEIRIKVQRSETRKVEI